MSKLAPTNAQTVLLMLNMALVKPSTFGEVPPLEEQNTLGEMQVDIQLTR